MNQHPIKIDINYRNILIHYFLISPNQVSEEWMTMLQELHGRRSDDNNIDFIGYVMCSCVGHFTNVGRTFLKISQEIRNEFPNGLEFYKRKPENIKFFKEGCELMDKWITPENKGIWQSTYQKQPFMVREPVYHIIYYTN